MKERQGIKRDHRGSLTVEALLILPLIFLLLALFVRWGFVLQNDLVEEAKRYEAGAGAYGEDNAGGPAFLKGGPPARRIRDADLLIDLGHSIKESLPSWFHSEEKK